LSGDAFHTVWRSAPFVAKPAPDAGLGSSAWTTLELDGNGLPVLLQFTGSRCAVTSFGPDSITTRELQFFGSWIVEAVGCDIDADSRPDLVTLELAATDSTLANRMLRVYDVTDSGFKPASGFISVPSMEPGGSVLLSGSARLEDYYGTLPVITGIYPSPRPGSYGIVHPADSGTYRFTTGPFPWQEWFSKDRVLPAGRLRLFTVGDTLCAYGYFVPGSRPGGPALSFAALQDGEWRLLQIQKADLRIGNPICRFTHEGTSGWLELRESILRFHPDPVFAWRDGNSPPNDQVPVDPEPR
jgi:hypothetical protein